MLDADLHVQQSAGQVRMAPVGSHAVRAVIERCSRSLGLHGHIHESAGFRRIGRTLAVNPGSDYGTGTLNGVLVTLQKRQGQGAPVRSRLTAVTGLGRVVPLLAAVDVGHDRRPGRGRRSGRARWWPRCGVPYAHRVPQPGWAEQDAAGVGRARRSPRSPGWPRRVGGTAGSGHRPDRAVPDGGRRR